MAGIILPWGLSAPGADDALLLRAGHPTDAQATALLAGCPPGSFIDLDVADPSDTFQHTEDTRNAVDTLVLLARTRTDLRRSVPVGQGLPEVRRLVVVIADVPKGTPPPLPAAAALPEAVVELGAERVGPVGRSWCIWLGFGTPCPAGELLAAVAAAAGYRTPAAAPTVALAGPGTGRWRPADAAAVALTEEGEVPEHGGVPAADLLFRPADWEPKPRGQEAEDATGPGAQPEAEPDARAWTDPGAESGADVATIHRPGLPVLWSAFTEPAAPAGLPLPPGSGPRHVPPVDEGSINPIGFQLRTTESIGELLGSGPHTGARIELDGQILVRIATPGAVTDADIGKLRDLRGVRLHWGAHPGPIPLAQVVAGLAAAGVPVYGEDVPPWLSTLLGPRLTGLIETLDPEDLDDPLRREEHSVRLRRAALRDHGTAARWAAFATAHGLPRPPRATVSVLLCTKRPEMLDFALAQVARQRDVDLELVLVLHGVPVDAPGVREAVAAFSRPVTVLEVPGNIPFGAALNQAAAAACGTHLAKMDDDDWYGPDHLADMLLARSYSGAELVGSAAEFIYLAEIATTVRRVAIPERFDDFVAGGTIVIDRDLFVDVGGVRPTRRSVDAHLLRATRRAGGTVYRTHGLGYVLRREVSGHTWQEPVSYFLRSVTQQWRGFAPSALLEATPEAGAAPYSAYETACPGRT